VPKIRKRATGRNNTAANVGYEAELWQMADALRDALLPKLISGELRVSDTALIAGSHGS